MTRSWARLCFCVLAAVVSAAIADPLLEALSNAGFFGPGNYTDHSTLDVLPVLGIGALLAVLHLSIHVSHLLRNAGLDASETLWALLPWIFVAQIAALYGMETVEQIVIGGHALGGAVWLGAPVAISLAAHAATCLLVTFTAAWLLRRCARAALRLAHLALRPIPSASRALRPIILDRAFAVPARILAPTACRIGERAPPFLRA
jgi:hypothetical protein